MERPPTRPSCNDRGTLYQLLLCGCWRLPVYLRRSQRVKKYYFLNYKHQATRNNDTTEKSSIPTMKYSGIYCFSCQRPTEFLFSMYLLRRQIRRSLCLSTTLLLQYLITVVVRTVENWAANWVSFRNKSLVIVQC